MNIRGAKGIGRTPVPTWARAAWGLGLAASLAVLLTLDGPGLTIDEPLDVRPGRNYVATLRAEGWRFFRPEVVDRVFRDNAEHPPLGRWLLGIASSLLEPFEVVWKGADPTGSYVLAGRVAPAIAFGLLVGMVAATAGRRWGTGAALAAGFALVAMPRVLAHAHLGALDTFLCLFWNLALWGGEWAARTKRPLRAAIPAGLLWSLALLTKIHAWFLPLFLGGWFFARLPKRRATAVFFVWLVTGLLGFAAGWPWLWYDGGSRLIAYLGTGVSRTSILVQYLGRVTPDRDVPWHYPFVYFLATLPPGLLILGSVGLAAGWRSRRADPFPILLAAVVLFFLGLFSGRAPVYDQERLFLLIFTPWALLVGLGFERLWERFAGARARLALVVFLIAQGTGAVMMHPFGLSYYNALVGGLPGAQRLGLELTYWGDPVDQTLLDRLAELAPRRARAALVPTLYPGQGILTTNRALIRKEIVLGDQEQAASAEWVVVSRRTAYWPAAFRARLERGEGRKVAERSRQGVWLAAIWHFPGAKPAPTPKEPSAP